MSSKINFDNLEGWLANGLQLLRILRTRSLLTLEDFKREDICFLLDLAAELKRSKYAGNEVQRLKGKNIALIFEKPSTRTRCAFEVAVYDQGGHVNLYWFYGFVKTESFIWLAISKFNIIASTLNITW